MNHTQPVGGDIFSSASGQTQTIINNDSPSLQTIIAEVLQAAPAVTHSSLKERNVTLSQKIALDHLNKTLTTMGLSQQEISEYENHYVLHSQQMVETTGDRDLFRKIKHNSHKYLLSGTFDSNIII